MSFLLEGSNTILEPLELDLESMQKIVLICGQKLGEFVKTDPAPSDKVAIEIGLMAPLLGLAGMYVESLQDEGVS